MVRTAHNVFPIYGMSSQLPTSMYVTIMAFIPRKSRAEDKNIAHKTRPEEVLRP